MARRRSRQSPLAIGNHMSVLEQIESVARAAEAELASVDSADALEQYRIKYLSTKGAVKNLMSLLGQVPREQKPAVGQRVNAVKNQLTAAFEARKAQLGSGSASGPIEDVTLPGLRPQLGNRHIMMKVVDELTD